MDSDFIITNNCIGRPRGLRRVWVDLVCRTTGHLLWRVLLSRIDTKDCSLPCYATYCRRCYRGGYVRGDYVPSALGR